MTTDTNLSDKIKQARYGAVHNPYQGDDKKVLFVCSMGILRSATGARIYAHKYNTRCAGTYDEALIQLTQTLIDWAHEIVFVHEHNYQHAIDLGFSLENTPFKVLNIPDQYEHMHPEIVKAYEEQYEPLDKKPDV